MTSKLIRLRVKSCGNGDDCPALDRREEGGIEVTGKLVHRPGLPPGEGTVLVPDTLLPEIASLHVDLGTFIAEHHHTDLLRVQTLDRYGVASDGDDYRRYLDGEPVPSAPGKQEWLDRLRTDTAAGRVRRNVHVVRAPLSPYLRYQFEWCYALNAEAGQEIRIVDVTEVPTADALLDVGDFTVIEGQHVARLRYSPDGEYQGAVEAGVDAVPALVALAGVAWSLATPFATWWAEHSQYHRPTVAA